MGDIGPSRQHYDVLPVPGYGVEDADLWTVAPRVPEPVATDASEPEPETR